MKTSMTFAAICIAVCLLAAPQAQAQACPAGITNPLSLLDGTNWAFHTEVTDYLPPGAASIGTFQAFIKNGAGALTVTETVAQSVGLTTRRATVSGRYTVYPDCSGGELMFMLNFQPVQFEFIFTHNFTGMNMVADANNNGPGIGVVTTGRAVLGAPTACPAGLTNPLSVLDGTTWDFRSESAYFIGAPHSANIGIFKPFIRNGAGALTVTETVTQGLINGAGLRVFRLDTAGGRYLIYPDCSGGEIMFMTAYQPVQYEFVFTNTAFTEMFLLSDSTARSELTGGFDIIRGEATR